MPEYAVARLEAAYGDLAGARVAVLGAAYRGGVKETTFSGVSLRAALRARGAHVAVHDPMFSDEELRDFGWGGLTFGEQVDAVVVQADRPEYVQMKTQDFPGAKVMIDGRAVVHLDANAVRVFRVGRRDEPTQRKSLW